MSVDVKANGTTRTLLTPADISGDRLYKELNINTADFSGSVVLWRFGKTVFVRINVTSKRALTAGTAVDLCDIPDSSMYQEMYTYIAELDQHGKLVVDGGKLKVIPKATASGTAHVYCGSYLAKI